MYKVIKMMVIEMEMVNRVEALIFNQGLNYPLVQIIKNETVLINSQCIVREFTDEICQISTPEGGYHLTGINLRIKEYGDSFIRIESDGIAKIEIIKDGDKK